MKGLVTVFGGSGFVGGQIVRVLARAGWRIRVAVRRPGLAYRMRMLGDVGQIELMQANVRNRPSVERALDGAEASVNVVGQAFERGRQRFLAVHHMGAQNIAEAAAARGITRFVHISGIGADEHAASRYARARALGEQATRQALPTAVIVRPSVIFGPGDDFLNRLAGLAAMTPVVPLFGGGATRLAPVYVADVAAAVGAVLADPASAGRTYELGGPAVYTLREIWELVLRETGHKRALLPIPFALATLMGRAFDLTAPLMVPPVTSDQVLLLQSDNVPAPGMPGLADLGITPTAVEAVAASYLYRYRRGGQYAELTAAAQR
jgi:uncharacterized protein YbjT (DUF2867 family)